MVIQGVAIINLIIAVIGSMSCVFSLYNILFGIKRDLTTSKLMLLLSILLLVRNICLAFLQMTQGMRGTAWEWGIYLAGFGTFLLSLFSAYIISIFLLIKLVFSRKRIRILRSILTAFLIICLIFLIWAQTIGRLVTINDYGMYYQGEFYYYIYIMIAIFLAFDIQVLFFHREQLSDRERISFGIFLTAPLLAILLKPLYNRVHLATLFTSISLMLMVIMTVSESSLEYKRQEALKKQLEIDLLLSQIQPHFLFNVLYVIQELCNIDPKVASGAIEEFSQYLRHNMDSIAIRTPIQFPEELDHVRHYVSLQQLRFGDALNVQYDLECMDFRMPTLTLQPIVENAVRYGVRMAPKGRGSVLIKTRENPDSYEIDVIDDGPGFDKNKIPNDGLSHTGLTNVRERLRLISRGELIVNSVPGNGTAVKMIIPKE